jgi:hypothetical protein
VFGEAYLTERLRESDHYLDVVIELVDGLIVVEPAGLDAMIRVAGDLLVSTEPVVRVADDPDRLRAMEAAVPVPYDIDAPVPSFADRPRWKLGGAPPATVVGAWLKALMVRDQPAQKTLRARTQWRGGELEFLRVAFTSAVRAYFADDRDDRLIAAFAYEVTQRFGANMPPAIDIEALIRVALDDPLVSADGIDGHERFTIYTCAPGLVVWKTEAPREAVDALVGRAERAAIEAGWAATPL